jgi:hypothetical protein
VRLRLRRGAQSRLDCLSCCCCAGARSPPCCAAAGEHVPGRWWYLIYVICDPI